MFCLKNKFVFFAAFFCSTAYLPRAMAAETAPGINDFKKPFNEYSWVTAHNGYLDDMTTQLKRGVRGFLLDLHPGNLDAKSAYLCHAGETGTCDSRTDMKFSDALKNVFLPYLRTNPDAVVSLLLETRVSQQLFADALNQVPGLSDWVFDPRAYAGIANWPTLEQMIRSGKRLVILTDRHAGLYPVNGKQINVLKDSQWETQNYWDLGITALKHDWSCPSRWSGYNQSVGDSGFTHWNRLFVMNQSHAWGSSTAHAGDVDNNLTWLERRVDQHCKNAIGFRKAPNYLAIDFNQTGDAFPYAAALTQGGFYFYEGNNADANRDTTCVIPAGHDYDFRLPARGCENDEARSLKLRGVAKGTRITLFDSPSSGRRDDYAIIDVKRNIGIDEAEVISTFERDYESAAFKLVYVGNNGLDGKVSRIKVEQSPAVDFSDASVVLYEGAGARENIVCTVSLARSTNFDFGKGCTNDEAVSARILKAKAGTRFTLYGNWGQKENQGYARVEVLRDITTPVVIGTFEKSFNGGSWRIIRSRHSNKLDGKISSMRVEPPLIMGSPR